MFTGIVQGLGKILDIQRASHDFQTHIVELPEELSQNLQIGASVAHNGCCLTITRFEGNVAHFDLMDETLAKTNLSLLKTGDYVNLERAAKFGDEIGGHLMSGHIIAQTQITRIERNAHNVAVFFHLPKELQAYVLTKGFIGLDGCSLTIGEVSEHEFNVHLIPETLQRTLFGSRQVGDWINVEIDPQTQAIVDTVQRILHNKTTL